MSLHRLLTALLTLPASTLALAQSTGTLTYTPTAVTPAAAPLPVPVFSFLLFPLGLALVWLGCRALRRQPDCRQILGALTLTNKGVRALFGHI